MKFFTREIEIFLGVVKVEIFFPGARFNRPRAPDQRPLEAHWRPIRGRLGGKVLFEVVRPIEEIHGRCQSADSHVG